VKYIECPEEYISSIDLTLFLAGGITNCENWQTEMVGRLSDTNLTLLNPRRSVWPKNDPDAELKQIKWEHRHLLRAGAILFWFPPQTVCPITLYELGAWVFRPKKLFIGCDPKYSRKNDVAIQTSLERPLQKVVDSMEALAVQVKEWAARMEKDKLQMDSDQPPGRKD
jgi:Nucleoside 2-deoxyribosyltransferase like